MTPADETQSTAPMAKPPRLHSLWQVLTSMRQGLRTRHASAYARVHEAVICLQSFTTAIVEQLRAPLLWCRLTVLICMLIASLFRMAEPDTWLGHLFASRFEAAKAGYRTLLQVTDLGEGRQQRRTPLTRHDCGFHEILELALASNPYVTK